MIVNQSPSVSPPLREALTPAVRLMLGGMLLSNIGNGLTISLLVVYLSSVRGIPTALAALVLTWIAVLGLALGPITGSLIDRVGPKWVLFVSLVIEALGVAAYAFVTTAPQAFAAATLAAFGGAAIWSAQATMMSRLVPEESRQRVFGLQFMLLNLGLGIGGLIAASIVDLARPETFVWLYLFDAFTYLAFLVVLPFINVPDVDTSELSDEQVREREQQGYREVLSDRRLRRLVVAALFLMTCGYGSMDGGLALFMTQIGGLPVRDIGIVFAVNTGVIVLAQWWVLKFVDRRSRTLLLALVGVLWAISWLMMGGSILLSASVVLLALCVGMAVFAISETLWSPIFTALINQVSPDHLRGRYNATAAVSYNLGAAIGPAVAGILIGARLGAAWIAFLVVGCLIGGAISWSVRRLLTADEDGRTTEGLAMTGSVS